MLTRQVILDAQQQTNERWARHGYCTLDLPTDALWKDSFFQAVRDGQREAVEDAILFLEVDPWYFRSGYLKARLCRALKAAPLKAPAKRRLLNVIYIAASGKHRQEFRDMCLLARKLATPEFIEKVRSRVPAPMPGSRNSMRYLLRTIEARGTLPRS